MTTISESELLSFPKKNTYIWVNIVILNDVLGSLYISSSLEYFDSFVNCK